MSGFTRPRARHVVPPEASLDVEVPLLALAAALGVLVLAVAVLSAHVVVQRGRIRALTSQRQSQAARYGQTMEQFAPFLEDWPWDPKGFRFLGDPIDGIQFNDDGIVIVEVKSARSRLSPRQAIVRRQVEEGRVQWREVRIS